MPRSRPRVRGKKGIHFPDLFSVLDERVYDKFRKRFSRVPVKVVADVANAMDAPVILAA